MVLSSSDDLENRFGYLLQPIRDLTRNWNVDIASDLEDYLEEIEQTVISFDGGATTMNFAEAALLIQGTASIYSKKVEYLHSLVYQVLDLMASKKKLKAAAAGEDGAASDATLANPQDDEEEMLSLDDIDDNRNIDMKNDCLTGIENKHITPQPAVTPSVDLPEIVIKYVTNHITIPRTPLALIKLNTDDKGENPLLSKNGEVLGSRNDFKMNTSYIHPYGAMLLDLSHLALLEMTYKTSFSTITASTNEQTTVMDQGTVRESLESASETLTPGEEPQNMSAQFENEDNFEPLDDMVNETQKTLLEKTLVDMQRAQRNKRRLTAIPPKPKVVIDYWQTYDQYQPEADKVFKMGKTFKMPGQHEKDTSRKRKIDPDKPKKELIPISEFCNQAFHSRTKKCSNLKKPTIVEFDDFYYKEVERRLAVLKQERRMCAVQGKVEILAEEADQQEDEEFHDDGGDEDNDDAPVDDLQVPDLLDPSQAISDEGCDWMNGEDEQLVLSTYEELVRNHVEGFLASAQQYAQITELSKRVSEWEEKIIPTLRNEEQHEHFDIHKYGSTIIDGVEEEVAAGENGNEETQEKILFKKVVEKKQPYDICRLFLATLQLANNYNVEISSDGTLEAGMDTLSIKILSKKRHFEELQEYKAPSLID